MLVIQIFFYINTHGFWKKGPDNPNFNQKTTKVFWSGFKLEFSWG